jgi:DNA repair protein RadC
MEKINDQTKQFQVAEIKLSYKSNVPPSQCPKISGSKDVYKVFMNSWDESKVEFIEQFKIMLVNRNNRVLGIFEVSSGCSTGTVVDPKLVFAAAIKANACSIILSHNHPSGNLKPSEADISLTKRLKEGGKILEIVVLDHLIITSEGYFSFADEGLI